MLTRLIVDLYAWVIEVVLWLVLLAAVFAGFFGTVPALMAAGWRIDDPVIARFLGVLFVPLGMFLLLVVFMGPFLVLLDIRKSVRALEAPNYGRTGSAQVVPVEYMEPHL